MQPRRQVSGRQALDSIPAMDIVGLHHVAVVAPDLDEARAFYGDLIGLKQRSDRPTDGRPGHWFDLGDEQLHVILPGGLQDHFAIEVPDIDAAVAELRAKGVDVPDPHGIGRSDRRPGETVQTLFVDPFGNRIEITQIAGRRASGMALAWLRAAAPDVAIWSDTAEKEGRLPPGLLTTMHQGGMFRLLLPAWLNGGQLDPVAFVEVMEQLAAIDASTAWCVCQAAVCSIAAAYLDRESAFEVFGAPESVLAWGPDSGNQAMVLDDGYRVSGRWSYASGIHHADWLGGSCRLYGPDGTPILTSAGVQQKVTVLFPAHHAAVEESWNVMGLRATGTDSFSVTELFVPARLAFARDDVTARLDPAPLYGFTHAPLYAAGSRRSYSESRAACCPPSSSWPARRLRTVVNRPFATVQPSRPPWHGARLACGPPDRYCIRSSRRRSTSRVATASSVRT